MLISSLNKGGSERVMTNLAEYFFSRGYRVTMVTQYQLDQEYRISPGIARILSDLTPEEEKSGRIANFLARFRKLRGIWKQERPDLILSFIGKNNIMAVLTSRFLGIPVVVSVRGEPKEEYPSRLMRLAAGATFRLAAGVVLQTQAGADFFPPAVQRKSIILKNSLNPDFLRPVFRGERQKEIVAVGRVDANKNHEMLIRSFAAIADRYPDYRLVIYGEGDRREALNVLVKELSLKERIHLPGSIEDVAGGIEQAFAFVLCSYSEGMPNTLIEAMALGLPVISTDCPCGGPGELIRQGENGLLIPPGDGAALTEALCRILDHPEQAEAMGRQAAEIRTQLDPKVINQSWETYFLCLIRGRKKK